MATIITREGKGVPLTNNEVDGNFNNLNTELATAAINITGLNETLTTVEASVTEALASTGTLSTGLGEVLEIVDGFGNIYAALEGATFTGPVYGNIAPVNNNTNLFATTEWVQREFGFLDVDLIPKVDLGVSLGSFEKRFSSIHADHGYFSANTVTIGEADISGSDVGGIVLPLNSAIGDASSIIPANLASTALDNAFSKTAHDVPISLSFIASTSMELGSPVVLSVEGTISVSNPIDTTKFIGISTGSYTPGEEAEIIISGRASGFSGLETGVEYYLDTDNTLSTTSASGKSKIGIAINSSTLFVYSTSTLDIYALSVGKIKYSDLSVTTASPSSSSGLSYDNTNGIFTFTPISFNNAPLTGVPTAPTASQSDISNQIATTAFVNTAISTIVGDAPGALDTLNELAEALGDDSNFAGTVTTALATKATIEYVDNEIGSLSSLDSPNFTGIPTAPTAAPTTNTNQVATTAFVLANGGGLNIDGGTATTLRNTSTIALNGGGA
jgi:hypothetical protein